MPPKKHANAKKDAPPPLPSRDHFERAHFAVQASVYLQQLVPGLGGASGTTSGRTSAGASGNGSLTSNSINSDGVEPNAGDSSSAPVATGGPCNAANEEAITKGDGVNEKGKDRNKSKSTSRRKRNAEVPYARLARSMGDVKAWTVHNQVKIDPSLKRALCATCSTVLIPGLTSRIRIRSSKPHAHKINHTCLNCTTTRGIPAAPTAAPEAGVDGPVRARRRGKLLRSVVFHEREAADEAGGKGIGQGHVLWRGAEKVLGWGVGMPAEPAEQGADQEPQKQKGQKGQNQQQLNDKNKQRPKQNKPATQPVMDEEAANFAYDEEEAMNM